MHDEIQKLCKDPPNENTMQQKDDAMDTSKEDMICQDDAMQMDFFKLEESMEDLEEAYIVT